jgi:hypothetical protein
MAARTANCSWTSILTLDTTMTRTGMNYSPLRYLLANLVISLPPDNGFTGWQMVTHTGFEPRRPANGQENLAL